MHGNEDIGYTDEFITKLQIAFGKGFLSPGGVEEVAKIVEGIDMSGKEVLDIGVGIGGPACLLVTNHGAGKVTGIDVEEPVLREAQATVSSQNLENQIDLQFVTPGPLPFDDATFDVVFSKDSIIHIPDKQSLFSEVYRVLKPGGWVVMSDWYCGEEPFTEEMSNWVERTGLSFAMTPIQNDGSLLGDLGFSDTALLDRNKWFADFSRKLVDQMGGPGYSYMVATLGQEDADDWLARAKARAVVSKQGQLRPGHIRGRKPL
ncbi:MAG: ubiquinone/menaquinone biosynthesis C-methylase UbiE [Halieaceae bacterium]|jgi:ubiquinone/menaquinone biosynthesis C-methylase UbiE